ncbi:MAG: ferredoxin [bacterium]
MGQIAKIEIKRDLCIGVASCVALAPNTFQLDEEDKAILLDQSGNNEQRIMDAARSCPVKAIILYDEEGKIIYPTV